MKWINLDDQFPQSDTFVLVCLSGKSIRVSYYFQDSYGKWFSSPDDIWDKYFTDFVTHWATLPEFPSEKY